MPNKLILKLDFKPMSSEIVEYAKFYNASDGAATSEAKPCNPGSGGYADVILNAPSTSGTYKLALVDADHQECVLFFVHSNPGPSTKFRSPDGAATFQFNGQTGSVVLKISICGRILSSDPSG
jgi:hypothetical protein